jgi:hypothetical protein
MNCILKNSILFILLLSGLVLVSCGSDDDEIDEATSIVGVWVSDPVQMQEDEYISEVTAYLWFKPDGTFVEVDVISGIEKTYYELSETGKWSVENDKLTFTTNFEPKMQKDYDITTFVYRITGNTMKVTYTSEGETGTTTLHKSTEEKMQQLIAQAKKK